MEIKIRLDNNPKCTELTKPKAPPIKIPEIREDKKQSDVMTVYEEINNLIGLEQIKSLIYEIQALINVQKLREKSGLNHDPVVLHAIFSGNPGSGKTTMARLLSKLFYHLGMLSKGHLIEVERADLVGEYIGHTAQKTKEQIHKAKGGILFIDEAYSLARGGSKDFGREAIDALVKGMEDYRTDFVLILAGYREEMKKFLSTNPGLNSRFPLHIDFPDYSLQQLLAIAQSMYAKRQYSLSIEAVWTLNNLLTSTIKQYPKYHGNGRLARNLVEGSLRKQAVRLTESNKTLSQAELMEITSADLRLDITQMINKPEPEDFDSENILEFGNYLKQLAKST